MKIIVAIILTLSTLGCESTGKQTKYGIKKQTRVTYYCACEDRRWGSRTASGVRAKAGVTVAAGKSVPFGTSVRIPGLASVFGDPDFVVQDRGSAVDKRKASHGLLPVIDVFTPNRKVMNHLAAIMPLVMDIE